MTSERTIEIYCENGHALWGGPMSKVGDAASVADCGACYDPIGDMGNPIGQLRPKTPGPSRRLDSVAWVIRSRATCETLLAGSPLPECFWSYGIARSWLRGAREKGVVPGPLYIVRITRWRKKKLRVAAPSIE